MYPSRITSKAARSSPLHQRPRASAVGQGPRFERNAQPLGERLKRASMKFGYWAKGLENKGETLEPVLRTPEIYAAVVDPRVDDPQVGGPNCDTPLAPGERDAWAEAPHPGAFHGTYNDFKIKLPDEWHAWSEAIADDLREQFTAIDMKAKLSHSFLLARKLGTRKEQAAWVLKNVPREHAGLVFGLLDGRDIADPIWCMIEPRGDE